MRRHTTKQPSGRGNDGEAQARKQRTHQEGFGHVSSGLAVLQRQVGSARRRRLGLAGQVMAVIVVVVIEAERARGLRAEQAGVLGMLRHRLRHARAAHVAVQADHPVALRHDDVQVVRHQQDAEPALGAQPADEGVELRLAGVVDAAHRLVQHQQVRRSDQRARQHHALQLAAGELRKLAFAKRPGADILEHAGAFVRAAAASQRHEARHG